MPHPDRTPTSPDSDAGAGAALRAMIDAALGELRADLPRALSGEAEAVHRMRSALRRLRAVLRAARPVLPASLAGQARALQRLGRALGPARDWDVFLDETLPRAAAEGLAPIALAALRRAAGLRRRGAYARLHRVLPGRFAETARGLSAWAATLPGEPALAEVPLAALAPKLLRRLARGLRGGARAIGGGPEKLHRLRKRTRRLRDAMAALAPEDRAVRRLFAATKRLTASLGAANDAANAVALAERLGGPRGAGPAPSAALSDWACRHERTALRGLDKSWRRLRARRERMVG